MTSVPATFRAAVVKSGPEDQTAVGEMAASSARYNQLLALKRGYLS